MKKNAAPTETRTQAKGFKVLCADHYTIGAQLIFIDSCCFLRLSGRGLDR